MSLQETPSGERVHIGFFGRRNAGKSSLVNAFTGQRLSVVSDVKGTTTDPVYKAMELLPMGPVMIIDTPGFDDEGALGALRVEKAKQALNKCDAALLVTDSTEPLHETDKALLALFGERRIPYLIVRNKCDLLDALPKETAENVIYASAEQGTHIRELKERVARLTVEEASPVPLAGDLVPPGGLSVLVTPIDSAAPKGRLILPQQQTIRDLLDHGAATVVVRETELARTLGALAVPPDIVITDSQAFAQVDALTPPEVPLTSFSILFARYKGDLCSAVSGVAALKTLQDGDTVLISEGCTHHRQCGDIGTVKLPHWILSRTGKDIRFAFTSGTEFPEDLSPYRMAVHCGGCMLSPRQMRFRQRTAAAQGVPMTNYGMLIAYLHGILPRALAPFPDAARLLTAQNEAID